MSLFETVDYRSASTNTFAHALVIGCGYPGLPSNKYKSLGGAKNNSLTTPWCSAKEFADWLMCQGDYHARRNRGAGFTNRVAPLGTVDFLASPDKDYTFPGGQYATRLTEPLCDEIETAFQSWLKRIAQNSNNLGIFYFCGHGLMDGDDHILLADGFTGEDVQYKGPWTEAFNMTQSVDGAVCEVEGSLYFFVDACMKFSVDVALANNSPRTFVHRQGGKPVIAEDHIYLRGTKAGQQAFGPSNGVANFTRALVKVLGGFCGRAAAGDSEYRVSWPTMLAATASLLGRQMQTSQNRQEVAAIASGNGGTTLRTSDVAPKVVLGLDVAPDGYRSQVEVWADNPKVVKKRITRTLTLSHEDLEVPQNTYQIGMKPPKNASFKAKEIRGVLLLPSVEEKIFPVP